MRTTAANLRGSYRLTWNAKNGSLQHTQQRRQPLEGSLEGATKLPYRSGRRTRCSFPSWSWRAGRSRTNKRAAVYSTGSAATPSCSSNSHTQHFRTCDSDAEQTKKNLKVKTNSLIFARQSIESSPVVKSDWTGWERWCGKVPCSVAMMRTSVALFDFEEHLASWFQRHHPRNGEYKTKKIKNTHSAVYDRELDLVAVHTDGRLFVGNPNCCVRFGRLLSTCKRPFHATREPYYLTNQIILQKLHKKALRELI